LFTNFSALWANLIVVIRPNITIQDIHVLIIDSNRVDNAMNIDKYNQTELKEIKGQAK